MSAKEFGVENADVGVRKMLALMWSKEPAAKDAVIHAYSRLYLNPDKTAYPSVKV